MAKQMELQKAVVRVCWKVMKEWELLLVDLKLAVHWETARGVSTENSLVSRSVLVRGTLWECKKGLHLGTHLGVSKGR